MDKQKATGAISLRNDRKKQTEVSPAQGATRTGGTAPNSKTSMEGLDWISQVTGRASRFEREISHWIRSNPFLVLTGAVILGLIADKFLTSGSKNSI